MRDSAVVVQKHPPALGDTNPATFSPSARPRRVLFKPGVILPEGGTTRRGHGAGADLDGPTGMQGQGKEEKEESHEVKSVVRWVVVVLQHAGRCPRLAANPLGRRRTRGWRPRALPTLARVSPKTRGSVGGGRMRKNFLSCLSQDRASR